MRKISYPKLNDYFSLSRIFQGREALIHYEFQNFNKMTSIVFFIMLTVLISLFEHKVMIIPLTLISYVGLLYLKTALVAKNLYLQRNVPTKGVENKKLSVKYIIKNNSFFNLSPFTSRLTIDENFTGTSSKNQTIPISESIKTKKELIINVDYPLNEGFGEHSFFTTSIVLEDVLGLFKFKIELHQPQKVMIFPEIQHIHDIKTQNNDETYLSGDFEIFKKGISPNFYSVRPYQYGDPMKFINWKLSEKIGELMVNEFENAVNLKINYLLNFDESGHLGKGINSTWEYAKDLCLSLVKNDIEKNHWVEIFSNGFHIKQGSGKKHFELIELKMCHLHPMKDDGDSLLAHNISRMQKGSALILIAPFNQGRGNCGNIDFLKNNHAYFSDVHLFFIDCFEAAKRILPDSVKEEILKEQKNANDYLLKDVLPLQNLGVKVHKIKVKWPHILRNQMTSFF